MNKTDNPNVVGHANPISAIFTGLVDLVSQKGQLEPLGLDVRLDGKTALVTGANTGLGKAVAIDLARRGAIVYMACRSGHPEAGEEVREASRSEKVEMLHVDLSDLKSVGTFCENLENKAITFDIAIFNAGLMPAKSRTGPQGFELMFLVHFLASRLILERVMANGNIKPDKNNPPRIIFVSSEAHRSAEPIDFSTFGEPVDYGLKTGLKEYGRTKLILCTFACELARRLNPDGNTEVSVHALCPGPIASNIAREAPLWAKPLLVPLLRLLFKSPEKAIDPVMLLAASDTMEGRNGIYLHMMKEKPVSSLASDPENGRQLWEKSAKLMAPYLNPENQGDQVN